MTHKSLDLHVPTLTRVEGEGAMHVVVRDGVVEDVQLEIYEPPRMFEAFLRGRAHHEPVDITARICGICPVAYQMSAAHAIEHLAGVTVEGPIRDLRRLLYCGEWIESHVLHMAFLHAPDFLGVDSGITIAREHPELMTEVLHLKKTGNRIMEVVGGRPIHPVNVRLGGFYRSPTRRELLDLVPDLERAHAAAVALVRWVAGFEFPSIPDRLAEHTEYVSLRHPSEYPFNEGRVVSNHGLDLDVTEYGVRLREVHVEHSTALHATLDGAERTGRQYQTGPLARWMNSADLVPDSVRAIADEIGVARFETNPFRSILVRGLETLWAVEEAQRIIGSYRPPDRPFLDVPAVAGTGHGCTEAPRGALYHRYEIDAAGSILDAVIVPPTSQNQDAIEADLRDFVASHLDLDDHTLGHRCEQGIRNYDPCLSGATHFRPFSIARRGPWAGARCS
ncbi:MAG TPA: nickel-dependent hydrogenase large subunit [Ilumatobacteraceae bacterium]|nr:nickel-dependent hydrogenase large subunit [Ilumatobacteraceae bacterium]